MAKRELDRSAIDFGDYRWNPCLKLMQHKVSGEVCPVRTNKERKARDLPRNGFPPADALQPVVEAEPRPRRTRARPAAALAIKGAAHSG